MNTSPIDVVRGARGLLDSVDGGVLPRLTIEEALTLTAELESAARRLDELRMRAAAELVERSAPSLGENGVAARHGYRRASHLLEAITGASAAEVGRRLRLADLALPRRSETGALLPPLYPAVASALADATLGVEAARAIVTTLQQAASRAAVDDLLTAERVLVDQAIGADGSLPLSADLIRVQAQVWRDRIDPDGVEPRADETAANIDFWVGRSVTGGVIPFGGKAAPEIAAILHAHLDAAVSPRTAPAFLTEEEQNERDLERDPRTPEQIRGSLFAELVTGFANGRADAGGAAPTVVVSVTADVLEQRQGVGTIVGIESPVPYSTIAQMICSGGILPAFIDPDGRLVALGTTQRLFTRKQRLGMIARDGTTCIVPGCRVSATNCEAHHIVDWQSRNQTDTDNGCLICWWHHRLLDRGEWTITMRAGRPRVHPPDWLKRRPYLRR